MMNSDQEIIPGIHNYCDRWCERCFFTSRCSVYESDKELSPQQKDIQNKAFWNKLSQNFAEALKLLHEAAASHGIDLTNIPQEELKDIERKQKLRRETSKRHILSMLSLQYVDACKHWLESKPGLEDKQVELIQQLRLGALSEDLATKELTVIKDCLEVIEWYMYFIHVKLLRAINSSLKDELDFEENEFQKDFNGSARIALVAIERSLQAWINLFQWMPAQEDDFLTILALLEKIKKNTEEEFPHAQQFRHPFFEKTAN